MFHCPHGHGPLHRANLPIGGLLWVCGVCDGRVATMPIVRRLIDGTAARRLWRTTFDDRATSALGCPGCQRSMLQTSLTVADEPVVLELCRSCHLVWFDAGELETLPPAPAPPVDPVPLAVRQQMAIATVQWQARQAREAEARELNLHDIRRWPALLGLPVEVAGHERSTQPWGTWLVTLTATATSIAALYHRELFDQLALVPNQLFDHAGLGLLSVFFVHGSWWHLIGNMYFLVVFGDNVEDFLGTRRWLGLLFAATIGGSLLQVIGDSRGDIPCVGASGGIAGLLAFYALRFPHVRLGMVWSRAWAVGRSGWFTLSARWAFVFWLGMQALLLWQQLAGYGRVAALAHLGGAAVGVIAWWLTRDDVPPG
jgi:membrane associated rhomboid family serine protease/Zn-finger nucleic acid-binding protein